MSHTLQTHSSLETYYRNRNSQQSDVCYGLSKFAYVRNKQTLCRKLTVHGPRSTSNEWKWIAIVLTHAKEVLLSQSHLSIEVDGML